MTPQKAYVVPILRSLAQNGGERRSIRVYRLVAQQMRFNDYDREPMKNSNPEPRWHQNMRAARKWMVEQGMLEPKSVSGWGRWRITRYGRYVLEFWEQFGRFPD